MLLWLTVLVACKKVEEAPEELDALASYLWTAYDSDEATLADAADNLHQALRGDQLDATEDGLLSPLTRADAQAVGLDRDPKAAVGLYIAGVMGCTLPELEEILSHPDQDELYPGSYVSYDRKLRSDRDDFLKGRTQEVRWDVTYEASILGAEFEASLTGGLRRVVPAEGVPAVGPVLFGRFHAPAPARFPEGSARSIDQDYQLEAWYERAPGEVVHFYAMWREADFGGGFTTEDEGIQRIILNNMDAWDKDTVKLCEGGLP
jgi:hypothetical protein